MFEYLTLDFLWEGMLIAIYVAGASMAIALVLGLGLALMRESSTPLLRWPAAFYVWLMRGTPILLQLVFLFSAFPAMGLELSPIATAIVGFSLNEAAFSGEVIRGGIKSVNGSQIVAARSLGMGSALTLRRVVLPQALRSIVPALGNNTISLLKMTSLASVIAVDELTLRSQNIVSSNFDFFPVFTAAGIMYLLVTSVMALGQSWLERRFSLDREFGPSAPKRRLLVPAFGRFPRLGREEPVGTVDEPRETETAQEAPTGVAELVARQALEEAGDDEHYVDVRGVRKSYGDREILSGVDLTARPGEVVVLMGPSGSGKSTLLRLVNHLEAVDGGEILVAGEHVGYERRNGDLRECKDLAGARAKARIGMVFQHFNLFDHVPVIENVTMAPVLVFGHDQAEAERTARSLLADVGLEHHAWHLPHRLSGGQQQRVAIARALAIHPRMMLFDEPTSALDPELVGEVLNVIRRLANAGMTMLVVTHEVRFAREVADRVVFMADGKVVEQGPPSEVLDNPREERTRQFLNLVSRDEGSPRHARVDEAADPAAPVPG